MSGGTQGRLWIKVCGVRDHAAIEAAAAAAVQAVGFVFHESSPRNVSVETACALQAAVPAGIDRVAVFLTPAQSLVDAVLEHLRPDWLQLDAVDLDRLDLPRQQRVLPVLRRGAPALRSATLPARFLLEGARSGAGEKADWPEAARLATIAQVVLAGGLDARNVGDALRAVRPFGVDVSSGVESSRGVKDAALIREFVQAARAAHAQLAI